MFDFIDTASTWQFTALAVALVAGLMILLQLASARRGASMVYVIPFFVAAIYLLASIR